jgi:NAD(P)-dependent dehydrogenase (short-subunit alcohol dehydrogenase family)
MTESRIALVTGATRGIGREIARQLLAEGLIVHVAGRALATAQAVAKALGPGARPIQLDVTDMTSITEMAARIDLLDVLVNNAGIGDTAATPLDASPAEFRRMLETNTLGPLMVTQALLPALRRSSAPRIVNISSGTASLTASTAPDAAFAFQGGAGAAYRTSKVALNALTVFTAQALEGEGFKVNAVAPGLRRTNLTAAAAAAGGDPAEGATGAVRLALLPDDGPTAGFYDWTGAPQPW